MGHVYSSNTHLTATVDPIPLEFSWEFLALCPHILTFLCESAGIKSGNPLASRLMKTTGKWYVT